MSSGKQLSALLLLSTALTFPAAAFAQSTGAEGPPTTEEEIPEEEPAQDAEEEAQPDISIPGGTIVVTGRRNRDVTRASPQVVTVLDTATIARTGEGDIAGALGRTTGLSEQGGLVYVRGLGDRYSLALLNGLPLPSPQPLSRVVPLDIFPTSVVASSLVQKTYSANFPGEFGGGVVNLTTRAIPTESFLTVSGSLSGDSETTFGPGYSYFGGDWDWTGFDQGRRNVENYAALQGFFDSGARINDENVDTVGILKDINDPNLYLVQKIGDLPANFSAGLTAGTSVDIGSDGVLGIIATGSISNKWRNRFITKQTASNAELELDSDFREFATDNRVLVNGLLGFGFEIAEHKFRFTNVYIHDTLKRASLEEGIDFQNDDQDFVQDTSWFERQLFNSQFVGELEFGDLSIDLRGGYAQTQREAPFEWTFAYSRPVDSPNDPFGELYLNLLDNQRGRATVSFSDLTEDLWYGGVDVGYVLTDWLNATIGYAYTDTDRTSSRREFDIRASSGFPQAFGVFRPDNLLGDALIDLAFDRDAQQAAGIGPYELNIFETTQADPAFAAALEIQAAYGKVNLRPFDRLSLDVGVRYEDAVQSVEAIEVFAEPLGSNSGTLLENDYWLPGGTLTWEATDSLQFRASASKTIARPQFRELIFQTYFDPETNRQFNGNPRLVDSELTNYEVRAEYYLGGGSRASIAGFYKDITNPIEVFTSFSDNEIVSGFANAPQAELYGAEAEFQYTVDLFDLGGWFDSQQLVAITNYTYTQSEIKVGEDDIARVFPFADQPAGNFFDDGVPLTGQSDHLVNLQLGLEDLDRLSQFTLLLQYASERVTSRGAGPLPDIIDEPGLQLDFVVRQGFELAGTEVELKFEARNLTGQDHEEFQTNGTNRIEINSYDVGRSFSLGASIKF